NELQYLHICEMEVLVRRCNGEELNFHHVLDTKLTGTPFDTINVDGLMVCAQNCLLRRSTDFCTAFNWVTSTNSCQLFSINPFLDLSANLTSAPGTYFNIQSN
ncbi:fucolectin-7, partial [Biomphalaria glabrata]